MLLPSSRVKRKAPGWPIHKYEQCMCRHIRLSISTILYRLRAAGKINPQLTTAEWAITAREQTGPQLARELPIFSSALERQKVRRLTNAIFNCLPHLNMQLLLDKTNLQEVSSCFEAVSYLLFLTGTRVVSRKSILTKYLTPRMKSILGGSSCYPISLNTAFQRQGTKAGPYPRKCLRQITYKITAYCSDLPKYAGLWRSSSIIKFLRL